MPEISTEHPPPRAPIIRRTGLYGAALGVIVGLIDRTIRGASVEEVAAIVRWRNFILVGTVIGILAGILLAWAVRAYWRKVVREANAAEQSGDSQIEDSAVDSPSSDSSPTKNALS
ncbi:hypothetical protein [Thalassoroseus pseudoceratinae]|uniref:hypothetical protein n=1 Tax=Thalassoroseus pseudoceratinae TaxID=2713176 RepID=UPI0014205475|nr:hypothetical protein [Thalassoroseus pseudoceratinae]